MRPDVRTNVRESKLPVRGDEPAELRYHLSIMAQPSLYVGMDFILEFYA